MTCMFRDAASFEQKLCGDAWVRSTALKSLMFDGSPGSVPREEKCKPVVTKRKSAVTATSRHVPKPTMTKRELIVRLHSTTSASMRVITSGIGSTRMCFKCGTFAKSGKVSCCAPGGSWFKNCGGAEDAEVHHKWSQGVEACARKYQAKSNAM